MKRTLFICLLLLASRSPALAQPRPSDQFYANSNGEHAWTTDTKKKTRTTTWFAKNTDTSPAYRQITAVIFDDKPSHVFYLDRTTKRVVGRLDLESEKFSLLAISDQKQRQALEKFNFPSGSALPRVEEMFEPVPDGQSGNPQRLQLPPPTLQFPRLERSTWETSYMSADRFLIRSVLQFNGSQGTYRLTEKPGTGQLSDIKYEREGDEHVIRGNWSLGRSQGWFKFNVPENLNVFWGEFGFQEGRSVGAWSGARRTRGASKLTEKPVR